jgi:NAD(P)-dependent dehydrogenase (short-subunit alcohol dehydrogenase family)
MPFKVSKSVHCCTTAHPARLSYFFLPCSTRPAVLASLSARVGSIGDNQLGGWNSYRASKTALNQLNKCLAIELERKRQKVACIVLHPGTVATDLSVPFQKNVPPEKLFTKERSVRQLLEVIDQTTMARNGGFFAYDGSVIPW